MEPFILIIEDEPAIADAIVYALESEGLRPLWFATAKDGLKVLDQKDQAIQLVILDVGLPDMNGFDVCRRIRKTHTVPILFLTARADEIDRVVGLEIGADDYMVKPFSPRELTARVRAILRRAYPSSITPSCGADTKPSACGERDTPFHVDEEKCRISFFNHPLTLSRYEYRLLLVLIKRPGRVFSREQLMQLAWDEPESSLDRTVDAHIKRIRAELRAVSAVEAIITHRGVGYALNEVWKTSQASAGLSRSSRV